MYIYILIYIYMSYIYVSHTQMCIAFVGPYTFVYCVTYMYMCMSFMDLM